MPFLSSTATYAVAAAAAATASASLPQKLTAQAAKTAKARLQIIQRALAGSGSSTGSIANTGTAEQRRGVKTMAQVNEKKNMDGNMGGKRHKVAIVGSGNW